jgi:pyruvate/2-oxoglutarate/acetoin dehydrogenase E1 component
MREPNRSRRFDSEQLATTRLEADESWGRAIGASGPGASPVAEIVDSEAMWAVADAIPDERARIAETNGRWPSSMASRFLASTQGARPVTHEGRGQAQAAVRKRLDSERPVGLSCLREQTSSSGS